MTNTELQALREATIVPNNIRQITASKLNAVLDELINKAGGWLNYNNSSETVQVVQGNVETQLTNDGAGVQTVTTYKPHFVDGEMLSNNSINLSGLPLGAIVHGRFSANLITTSNHTEIRLTAKFKDSEGQIVTEYPFGNVQYKNQGNHTINRMGMFFVTEDFSDGTIEFYAESDENFNILWTDITLDIR